jgi:hypothetical protein
MAFLADAYFPLVYYLVPAFCLALVLFALAAECLTFYSIQSDAASLWYAIASVGVANLCSAAAGFAAIWFLPGVVQIVERRRTTIFVASLFLAYVLSVVIEYVVLLLFPRWRTSRRLLAAVAVSNLMSYSVLGIGIFIVLGFVF